MTQSFFTPATFRFLRDLKANNSSEWFQANKARFEDEVREPFLAFIQAFAAPLAELSRSLEANPSRSSGSMFRINRDIRFGLDKTPYKTNVGAQFRHRSGSRDVHAPAFYLHLEPGGCFAGAGLWHPDRDVVHRVRTRILEQPRAWQRLHSLGLEVQGERLTRAPQGFPADHPLVEDLKLKDFYTLTALTEAEVCGPRFLEQFSESCQTQVPLMKFLTKALDLPW